MQKFKALAEDSRLELERALTPDERRRLLDAADHLPVLGGRSRDRRRCKDVEFPDERPRRKGYRPWRNRAIIYTLIETGMRRAEVTSIDLQTLDLAHHTVLITEKGGRQQKCQISKEGLKAIKDYLREERGGDSEMFPTSPALFLPADTVVNSAGRLSPSQLRGERSFAEASSDSRRSKSIIRDITILTTTCVFFYPLFASRIVIT